MGLARDAQELVIGQAVAAGLQPFLEQGLRVLALGVGVEGLDAGGEQPRDDAPGRLEAAVQQGRAQDGLEGVGEDGGTLGAAALQLPLAEAEMVAQVEPLGDLEQGLLVDQVGAQPGKGAFLQAREALVEHEADDAVEHPVAQELQALVVAGAETAVGEGLGKQVPLLEAVAQLGLELPQVPRHQSCFAPIWVSAVRSTQISTACTSLLQR